MEPSPSSQPGYNPEAIPDGLPPGMPPSSSPIHNSDPHEMRTVGNENDPPPSSISASDKSIPIVSPSTEGTTDSIASPSTIRARKRVRRKKDEEKEEVNPSIPHKVPAVHRSTEVCKVNGHLSFMPSNTPYSVTRDEILRRISLPEGFYQSHISRLLKKGKTKDARKKLQELLDIHNLSFPDDNKVNRKRVPFTVMSGFLEGEAMQFASDHKSLINIHFPTTPLARLIIRDLTDSDHLAKVVAMVKDARNGRAYGSALRVDERWMGERDGLHSCFSSQTILPTHVLGIEECLTMTSLFSQLIETLDEECSDHIRRLKKALAVNPHAWSYTKKEFPTNLEQPEIPNPYPDMNVPDMEEEGLTSGSFAEIDGRLAMVPKKYNITVAEMYRRMRLPELLNLSTLVSLLRRGKVNDSVQNLKEELANHCIKIKHRQRNELGVTAFTALSEGEGLSLAKDMDEEINRTFPFRELIEALCKPAHYSTPKAFEVRKRAFQAASSVALMLRDLVLKLRLPVADRFPNRQDPRAYIILNYCSVTHGYGPDAVCSWLSSFRKLFDEAGELIHEARDKQSNEKSTP